MLYLKYTLSLDTGDPRYRSKLTVGEVIFLMLYLKHRHAKLRHWRPSVQMIDLSLGEVIFLLTHNVINDMTLSHVNYRTALT